MSALEEEHDRQREERADELDVLAIEPETGETYFGRPGQWPAESLHHTNHLKGECDCQDWRSQKMAGRERPRCKHLIVLERRHAADVTAASAVDYRTWSDADAIAEGERAKADLGF